LSLKQLKPANNVCGLRERILRQPFASNWTHVLIISRLAIFFSSQHTDLDTELCERTHFLKRACAQIGDPVPVKYQRFQVGKRRHFWGNFAKFIFTRVDGDDACRITRQLAQL